VLLALSRSTGPFWLALDSILVLALFGYHRIAEIVRAAPTRALATALAAVAAVGANRLWEYKYGPHVTVGGFTSLSENLSAGRHQLVAALQSAVGWFGYLEVRLPRAAIVGWLLLTVGLFLAATRRGTERERAVLVSTAVTAVVAPVLLYTAVVRHTGFGLQGRHILPVLTTVPIISGEVLRRHAAVEPRALTAVTFPASSLIHMLALVVAARAAATGPGGSWWVLGSTDWSPPGGWGPWLALGLLAALGLAALAVGERGPRTSARLQGL
jgi:hypothetical protein